MKCCSCRFSSLLAFDSAIFVALLMVFSGLDFSSAHLSDLVSYDYGMLIAIAVILVGIVAALATMGSRFAKYLGAAFYLIMAGFFAIATYYGFSEHDTTALLLLFISLLNFGFFARQICKARFCRGKPALAPKSRVHSRKR